MKMRKTLFSLLFILLISLFAFSTTKVHASDVVVKIDGITYYASPNGSKDNTGSSASSPLDIYTAMFKLTAGDTLYMAPGTYVCDTRMTLTESGNAFSYISVIASSTEKTIFDFSNMLFDSTNRGIQINADYWYFYGIDVTGAGDNGMYIAGNHNKIEMCEFYANRDSGLQLGRGSSQDTTVSSWPSYNEVINCTSYNNYDDETYGENADGFAAKLTVGYGNVFDGCIAYRNSDDGWDLYAKSDTGNVGTVIIKNCAAFENGWLLDGSTTRDGDGIGFKLGGSNMEGDVIITNCVAWNNHLHGFSDNSNPRTIIMENCTSYNNSVKVIDGKAGYSDGGSVNFNLARNNESYNIYYGLLSYSTNMTSDSIAYELGDDYLGTAAYCIFNTSKGVYKALGTYSDASSYEDDKAGMIYSGLKDSSFASVTFGYTETEYPNLHRLLRNDDNSINMGTMLDVVDAKLLTYCDGKQIGSKLNLSSWDEYDHFEYTKPTEGSTVDQIELLAAYDALEIMCNPIAVYQDVTLWTSLNDCKISWESSDTDILEIGNSNYSSFSAVTYVNGVIHRSRFGDQEVTMSATISLNDEKLVKDFILTLKKDDPTLGYVKGIEESYIIDRFSIFNDPEIVVTNKNSYSDQALLKDVDYGVRKTYRYAETKTGEFNTVSKVYTAVAGVYEITYHIYSYIDVTDTLQVSCLVYVVSPDAEIDFVNHEGYEFYVCQGGVHIIGTLTNVAGNLYAYLSPNSTQTVEEVLENGTMFNITSDSFDSLVVNENDEKYYIHVVVENKAGSYRSKVYTEEVTIVEISTCQEFYDLVNGGTSSVVIYLLKNDLDFSSFTWTETENTSTFDGLLNGDGYTISNITINGTSDKNCNLIYKLKGGTIMNINFDNIKLLGDIKKSQNVGIVGQMVSGYLYNIGMTNITSTGYQSVGGLLAKVCGGDNYFSRVSLINEYEFDENYVLKTGYPYFTVTTKYVGGMIGNIQKDTSEDRVNVMIDNCYCDAYVGTGGDSGGYVGGIVGRVKNDFETCSLTMTYCIFDGVIETTKNYTGGILAGCDNGAGDILVTYCVSRPVIIYGSTRSILDGVTLDQYGVLGIAVKTGSPILGRYTAGAGTYVFMNNFATFTDYNSVVGSSAGEEDLTDVKLYSDTLRFNMTYWVYDNDIQGIKLRTLTHN